MGNLTQGGGASSSPEPVVIFEGDISAQTVADRVIDLNFDLPETGRLYFTGDTAQIDDTGSQIVVDTPGKKLLTFGDIFLADLIENTGITEAQAALADWEPFPNIPLYSPGLVDYSTNVADEEGDGVFAAATNYGVFIARIVNASNEIIQNKLAFKIGSEWSASANRIRDLAPLKIRWIP